MRWLLLLCSLLWVAPAYSVESVWGRGSDTFYGVDSSFGASARMEEYEFYVEQPYFYVGLDRTDPTPGNWETDTGGRVAGASIGPWRTVIDGGPPSDFLSDTKWGNVIIGNDEAGANSLEWWDDSVDNMALNVSLRAPFLWNSSSYERQIVLEYKVGMTKPDDSDVFVGVCTVSEFSPLNTNGTLSSSAAGFHILRTEGTGVPRLAFWGDTVTGTNVPVIPPYQDTGGATGIPGTWTKLAIVMRDINEYEWYMDGVLVGVTDPGEGGAPVLELAACAGAVTTGEQAGNEILTIDRLRVLQTDF